MTLARIAAEGRAVAFPFGIVSRSPSRRRRRPPGDVDRADANAARDLRARARDEGVDSGLFEALGDVSVSSSGGRVAVDAEARRYVGVGDETTSTSPISTTHGSTPRRSTARWRVSIRRDRRMERGDAEVLTKIPQSRMASRSSKVPVLSATSSCSTSSSFSSARPRLDDELKPGEAPRCTPR